MHIVTAGVHHGNGPACAIGRCLCAGIGQAGLFSNRQRVHIGTEHDGRSVAVAQNADDSGLADSVGYVVSDSAEPV